MKPIRIKQRGSVSLFIVIFAALLIITISTAFIRLMIQDQFEATSDDLSKSALDSAYAGVEDAKRAIVEYYQRDCQDPSQSTNSDCMRLKGALVGNPSVSDGWTTSCKATVEAGPDIATLTNGEVPVQTTSEDFAGLDQAYTCVNVQMNPDDYVGALTPGTSRFIHLKTFGNAPFTQIKIQWFSQNGQTLDLGDGSSPYKLTNDWPSNRPGVLKAQLLQYNKTTPFKASDFDNGDFNSTLFLMPTDPDIGAGAGTTTGQTNNQNIPATFASDSRRSADSNAAQPIVCNKKPSDSRYACEVTIAVPDWGDGANANTRDAYLKLSQFYSTSNNDFRISLIDASGTVPRFTDVQPAIDSTGRANDLFRRIRSRIDIGGGSLPNAEAAVDVTKSLCKNFSVTNDSAYADSDTSGICAPLPTP